MIATIVLVDRRGVLLFGSTLLMMLVLGILLVVLDRPGACGGRRLLIRGLTRGSALGWLS